MLTVRQLLVVSGQSGEVLHANALPRQFIGRSLSLKSAIATFEKQRRTYFVSLVSPGILVSNDVHTFEDVVRLSSDFHGQMTRDEVVGLAAGLERFGVLVRLVDKEFRHAALVGTVPSLVSVPTVEVNGQNFIQIRDAAAALGYFGGAAVAYGSAVALIATIPEPASPVLFFIGIGLLGLGSGLSLAAGVIEMDKDSSPAPAKDSSDKTKSEVESPGGQDDDDQDSIEIPNAVAIGDPPNGFDVDGLLADMADFTLDLAVSDIISLGWDSDAGVGLPGLGGDDFGGGGGGVDVPPW